MSDTDTLKRIVDETLDADMTRNDLANVLERLRFSSGHSVIRLDRDVRDYLVRLLRSG